MDELRGLVFNSQPDVIALCESWLDSSVEDSEVALPSYCTFCRDHSRHGGGVIIYIKDSLTVHSWSSHATAEFLSVTVYSSTCPSTLFGLYYRPP